jgi:beta-galactosidase
LPIEPKGFEITASVWPYTAQAISQANHIYELPEKTVQTINIDYLHMGVGGDDSWTVWSRPHDEYRIQPDAVNFSFVFEIIGK